MLAHRLSLFMFFWNAENLSDVETFLDLREPLRVVMITRPRKFFYRIYSNQNTSDNDGRMRKVNWYDGNNLGLYKEPTVMNVKSVYENFNGRNFIVPVIHVSGLE